jgi:2-desacetyl-2-hydroxyethyl bacteriochlorophyllide A dehydrogenase
MKAGVFLGVNDFQVKSIDKPQAKSGEALVEIKACGICGTDISIIKGDHPARCPVVLGHEASGRVVAVGENVRNVRKDDRVVLDSWWNCGTCFYCRKGLVHLCDNIQSIGVDVDGAFAEFIPINAKNLHVLPQEISYEQAALIPPIACVIHSLELAQVSCGDTVTVIGVGPMGLLQIQLIKALGSSKIIAVARHDEKLQFAKKLGADETVNATSENFVDKVKCLTDGRGSDIVIEAAGSSEMMENATKGVRKGGRVVIFGCAPASAWSKIRPFDICTREISIIGSFVNPFCFSKAITAVRAKKLDVNSIITHQVALSDIQRGIELKQHDPRALMILVKP